MKSSSIFDINHIDELKTYTYKLFNIIQKKYALDHDCLTEILQDMICETPRRCTKKMKSGRLIKRCPNASIAGCAMCVEHNVVPRAMEYVVLDNVEYLYDPRTKALYSYKTYKYVGVIDSETNTIIAL